MRFTPEDASARYRGTLARMQPGKLAELGEGWDKATLAFFFGADPNPAVFSARDTLVPMLREDQRVLADEIMRQFLGSIKLDQQTGDVAEQVFETYAASTPRG
jgi:hypothetical protein